MNRYEINCTDCNESNDITLHTCTNCGSQLPGFLNTRRASISTEKEALIERYEIAKTVLTKKNLDNERLMLETEIKGHSKAVMNTSFTFLFEWLIRGKDYQSYRRQLLSNSRPSALFENDTKRTIADSVLFGSENDILYAALTINEIGLTSYGAFAVILKTSGIIKRTSALEMNSFLFLDQIQNIGWKWKDPLPPGFMSVWEDLYMLVVSKLFEKLKKGISVEDMARLVLYTKGDRNLDEFIELYIYGTLNNKNVEKVRVSAVEKKGLNKTELLRLKEIERNFQVDIY